MSLRIDIVPSSGAPSKATNSVDMRGDRLTVGRARTNDVVLPDSDRIISGSHLYIERTGDRYILVDTSTNGVALNGQLVQKDAPTPVADGDTILLGPFSLNVTISAQAAEAIEPVLAPPSAASDSPFPEAPYQNSPLETTDPTGSSKSGADSVNDPLAALGIDTPSAPPADQDGPAWPSGAFPEPNPGADLHQHIERPRVSDDPFTPSSVLPGSDVDTDIPEALRGLSGLAGLAGPGPDEGGDDPGVGAAETPAAVAGSDPFAQLGSSAEFGQSTQASTPLVGSASPDSPAPVFDFGGGSAPASPQSPPPQAPPQAPPPNLPPSPAAPALEPQASQGPVQPAGGQPIQMGNHQAALLQGLGLDPRSNLTEQQVLELGQTIHVILESFVSAMKTRGRFKAEIGVARTQMQSADNNPIKLSQSATEVLERLFLNPRPGYLGPLPAAQDAVKDLAAHELAMFAALKSADKAMVAQMNPDRLEAEFQQGRGQALGIGLLEKSRHWEAYRELFKDRLENGEPVLTSFADGYNEAVWQIEKQRSSRDSER